MANPPKLYVPVPAPVVDGERRITRDWLQMFDQVIARIFASGTVVGPATSTDNAIALFSGTSGQILKAATGTGVVHATSGVYSAADVTLPELVPATAPSRLVGRGSAGAGDFEEIALGANLVMTGTTLSATTRASAIVTYSYSAATTEPPGVTQVRFDAGYPYTTVTKVWVRNVSADGQDVFLGLMIISPGSTLLVQDENDHTMYARFRTTGVPIDKGAYVELPVEWMANGVSLGGGQPVLLQAAGGATTHAGTIGLVMDGGGSTITTGIKGFYEVGVTCTITAVTLLSTDAAATAGSIVVDIWKAPYAGYPPTVANTITASAKPTLSSANKSQDTTLTGWTTSIAAGDILAFSVDSATTVTKVALTLTVQL